MVWGAKFRSEDRGRQSKYFLRELKSVLQTELELNVAFAARTALISIEELVRTVSLKGAGDVVGFEGRGGVGLEI